MNAEALISHLKYNESPCFLDPSQFDRYSGYSFIFRQAQKSVFLKGVYTLKYPIPSNENDDSIIPFLYVCESNSEEKSRDIHRLVWNQNIVPLLLVVTPKSYRLYPGFKYESGDESLNRPIVDVLHTANDALTKLIEISSKSIDEGNVWNAYSKYVTPETRVDWKLLGHLKELGKWLINKKLPSRYAHSLIGKYVYLRYLKDRDILSARKFSEWNIPEDSVFGRNATPEGLYSIDEKLEGWLNGSVFPIPKGIQGEYIQKVASVFLGDEPSGQLHLDFEAFDFSHIPIEVLSVVYQQFLHAEGEGQQKGAYYTPVHLVNFIIDELDAKSKLKKGMKVFDPACGSGAFLVQCYRRLIEREHVENKNNRLRPVELRNLLTEHIYGLDRDPDACSITELSLVLTLLDYVTPADLKTYPTFKLPSLRNKNVYECDYFQPDSIWSQNCRESFDWIVGNPPWKKLNKNEPSDCDALKWIAENQKEYPVGNKQIAEAFSWKVTQSLAENGCVGLVMPCSSLVSELSKCYRSRFFEQEDVWCVVNFANLRKVLFGGAISPMAAFFYSHSNRTECKQNILTYAPFIVNQFIGSKKKKEEKVWSVTIDSSEIKEVKPSDYLEEDGPVWKIAMWGSHRDRKLLSRIRNIFPSLYDFSSIYQMEIHEGFQLRNSVSSESIEEASFLIGKKELDMEKLRGVQHIFSFSSTVLKIIDSTKAYVRKGRGDLPHIVSKPPHIIVDESRRFAVYSDEYIVVPARQIGISSSSDNRELLKILSLYLSSDFVRYHQFMISAAWGIERDRSELNNLLKVPIPLEKMDDKTKNKWLSLHDKFSKHPHRIKKSISRQTKKQDNLLFEEMNEPNDINALVKELNDEVYDLLGVNENERCLIEDLIRVRIKMRDGQSPPEAVRPADDSDMMRYANILKSELDDFLDCDQKDQHKITIYRGNQYAVVEVDRPRMLPAGSPVIEKVARDIQQKLDEIRPKLQAKHSQWFYLNRGLKVYEGLKTYVLKPLQRLYWLRSQALIDSDELIADKISLSGDSC